VRRLLLAVTFLTGLPLPVPGEARDDDLWGSMAWYPLVGAGLGFAGFAVWLGLSWLLPPLVAAALVIVLLELFTRALHLDGLMDTCDGYFSGAPRERALEIMKDSRSGAMGVFGAITVIVVKIAALGALAADDALAASALVVGWTVARVLPPIDLRLFRYARARGMTGGGTADATAAPDETIPSETNGGSLADSGSGVPRPSEGTGAPFARGRGPAPLVAALLTLFVVAAVTAAATLSLLAVVIVTLVPIAVALAAQAAVSRRLGGLTGDVYGMGIELAEAAALVTAAAFAWRG
jgi:adenosylcobinamide-GDP ribazoletransferase